MPLIFSLIDQPKVVKERTEDHPYHDNHDETTSSTNSGDRSWHNGKRNSLTVYFCLMFYSLWVPI